MSATVTVQAIFHQAMQLSEDDRRKLLDLLAQACSRPDQEWWGEIEEEMEDRLAALESGDDPGLSLDEVRKQLFERLRAARD